MTTKSPTTSVRSREIIGVELFSQRREVFGKHDTVFLPLPLPTTTASYKEVEPIVSSNHGKTTSNFKRNTPGYSSMRESRTEERNDIEFRPRKYSDNFTSELNQSDDVDYRYSMTERTRRLSKLRREFLTSNLHEPTKENTFARSGTRSSMPARGSPIKYKIESPNLYKFPFAEPYSTPTPTRRVVVDLGPVEREDIVDHQECEIRPKHQSLPNEEATTPTVKIDHQKLFEELVKRYSPQRKPIDWTLPPTRPRVVGSVPKSVSSVTDSVEGVDEKKYLEERNKSGDDDVFENKQEKSETTEDSKYTTEDSKEKSEEEIKNNTELIQNGLEIGSEESEKKEEIQKETNSKVSLTELAEKNDQVPELSTIQRQISRESTKKQPLDKITDLTIPALLEKMTVEGENLENNKPKKIKRKRSFLDKLLGRKKDK